MAKGKIRTSKDGTRVRPSGKPEDFMKAKDAPSGKGAKSFDNRDWRKTVQGEFPGSSYSDSDHD